MDILSIDRRICRWLLNRQRVVDVLRNLEVSDFSEAKIDKNDPEPPILMVFGKYINEKNVYIKIKCRETDDMGQVICVSFHYAQWDMCYPFKY